MQIGLIYFVGKNKWWKYNCDAVAMNSIIKTRKCFCACLYKGRMHVVLQMIWINDNERYRNCLSFASVQSVVQIHIELVPSII